MLLGEWNSVTTRGSPTSFNGHPPLGVNATLSSSASMSAGTARAFQRAPTLGGECYCEGDGALGAHAQLGFNGHPPLGVNATWDEDLRNEPLEVQAVSTGTHPWG